MRKKNKFALGGLLVTFSLLIGGGLLPLWMNIGSPAVPIQMPIMLTLPYLFILLWGLFLIADAVVKE